MSAANVSPDHPRLSHVAASFLTLTLPLTLALTLTLALALALARIILDSLTQL